MNRKLAVFIRYRGSLQFLSINAKRFAKLRDTLMLPHNHTNLTPFEEVAHMLAGEN